MQFQTAKRNMFASPFVQIKYRYYYAQEARANIDPGVTSRPTDK